MTKKNNERQPPYIFANGGFTYEVNRKYKTVSVIAYSGSGKVVIPDTVTDNGISYQVTAMKYNGVYCENSITCLIIPDSIVKIEAAAFISLQEVTNIVIGNGVTEISLRSFYLCGELERIDVSKQNSNYSSVDGVLFNKDKTELLYYPLGRKGAYTVPDGVIKIGAYAFMYCSGLTDIVISDTVTELKDSSFYTCTGLKNIILGNQVQKIDEHVFEDCKITEVSIPDSVTEIAYGVFSCCHHLEKIIIGKNEPIIKEGAFFNCENLAEIKVHEDNSHYVSEDGVLFNSDKTVLIFCVKNKQGTYIIPDGVKKIGMNAFENCNGLTNIIIPKSTTEIGESAFAHSGLNNIVIPDSVTEIGDSAFYRCDNLTDATISGRLKKIGRYAFGRCKNLTSIKFLNSVKKMGDNIFSNCVNLTDVVLSQNLTNIGANTFERCERLTEIIIPENVTKIGEGAFECCKRLKKIVIPDSVTEIGDDAFNDCGLTEVEIGNNVESIGKKAFYNCKNIRKIIIASKVAEIGDEAFAGCSSLSLFATIGTTPPDIGSGVFDHVGEPCILDIMPGCYDIYSHWIYENNLNLKIEESNSYFTDGGLRYGINNDKVTATLERCNKEHVIVPETVSYNEKSYRITAINLFHDSLTSLRIPRSVTKISTLVRKLEEIEVDGQNPVYSSEDGVLFNKDKTVLVYYPVDRMGAYSVPDTVVEIATGAFTHCTGLTKIIIPESVTKIADGIFYKCPHLSEIEVKKENPKYCSDAGVLFSSDKSVLMRCLTSKQGNYTIPDGVLEISNNAFENCNGLTDIVIPDTITEIGESAFSDCSSLTGIVIPNSVTELGKFAFSGCYRLVNITIGKGLTKISDGAFRFCETLAEVTIPDNVLEIEDMAFDCCLQLTTVYLGKRVAKIEDNVFYDCRRLTKIKVAKGNRYYVTENGVLFNRNKTKLKFYPRSWRRKYTIPDSVKEIGHSAFYYSKITGVVIPDSVKKIGVDAFFECRNLVDVVMGKNITDIGTGAFYNCRKMTSAVVIPEGVTKIVDHAFQGCPIPCVTIGDHVETIGRQSFGECTKLTEVVIPESVKTIGHAAFIGCSNLVRIVIPERVVKIGHYAFERCENLTEIEVSKDNRHYISEDGLLFNHNKTILIYCAKNKQGIYVIPETVTWIERSAFENCEKITGVVIPQSVNHIGLFAFVGCSSLSVITVSSPMPPTIDKWTSEPYERTFGDMDHCELMVPVGSNEAYAGWADKYGLTIRNIE